MLRFVTSNPDKLREASQILRRPLMPVRLELEEIQTADLERLVRHKAQQAYRQVRLPLIVEDTALVFREWTALPGPFVKFFLRYLGLEGMVNALAPFDNWEADALCGVGYHDGQRVHYFEGRVPGIIVSPAGQQGFGWDPIFQPEGAQRTFAEMSGREKHAYSMRGRALAALADYLERPRGPEPSPEGRPPGAPPPDPVERGRP